MNQINWKQKLTSRKFWVLVAALATAILTGVATENTIAHVVSIISGVGACVAYMFAEAKVDAARINFESEESDNEETQ